MASTIRVLRFPGSSAILEARYDLTTKTLTIKFPHSAKSKDGKWKASTWEFTGVAAEDFANWSIADSPGAYFNQTIRTIYPSTRISPPPEPKDSAA